MAEVLKEEYYSEEINPKEEKRKTWTAVAVLAGFGAIMGLGALAGIAIYVYL